MKRFFTAALLILLVTTATTTRAEEEYGWRFAATTTDIFLARPFTFAAGLLGTAIWVVSLPITAPTRTTTEAYDALVRHPWDLTFKRELGDFKEN